MKKAVIVLLLLCLETTQDAHFDSVTAKCIIELLYLDDLEEFAKQQHRNFNSDFLGVKTLDFVVLKLKKIRDTPVEQLSFIDFNVPNFVSDINKFFMLYSSVMTKVDPSKAKKCDLGLYEKLVVEKCTALYRKPCVTLKNDPFTAIPHVPKADLYLSHAYYPKCPFDDRKGNENGEEKSDKYRCRKKNALMLKPFASEIHCKDSSKEEAEVKCVKLPQDIWVRECPPGYERLFNLLCIFKCPPTWINDRRNCQKLNSKRVEHPVVVTFYDLIRNYEVPED